MDKFLFFGLIISVTFILIKLIAFSFKVAKYGTNTTAILIGYEYDYDDDGGSLKPIVKFQLNDREVITKSGIFMLYPAFKIGDKIKIRYYVNGDIDEIKDTKIMIKKYNKDTEIVKVNKNVKCNIIDMKAYIVDLIIGWIISFVITLILYIF